MPRTLHLHWPGLVSDAAAPHLRSAQHALGRISPLVYWSGTRIEIGIDGLQARNGASVVIDLFEGRGAREAIRNGRIAPA